ncbi:MAG: hypothetical protein WCF84_19950 [Anaerolineae bacterium]
MHHRAGLLVVLALGLLILVSPVQAAGGAICLATPVSGPPGTAFTFTCTGFSPNTIVNAYVTEPDGRAVGGSQVSGFVSNLGNGGILTDKTGTATFTWQTAGGGAAGFAVQFGAWTWVVHQLGQGGAVVVEGQLSVNITAMPTALSGAVLTVSPSAGTTFNFLGAGFDANEMVNTWVTLPPDCSGRTNVEGASAAEPLIQGLYDGFYGPNTVKADKDGSIAFSLVFYPQACRGFYSVTAHALASERGGIASFEVTGSAPKVDALLTATPGSVNATAPFLTLLGSGFQAGTSVNCWTTRPDSREFGVGTAAVDGSGNFALSIHASGFDSVWPFSSEDPGIWYATCRSPAGGLTGVTSFIVTSMTTDP